MLAVRAAMLVAGVVGTCALACVFGYAATRSEPIAAAIAVYEKVMKEMRIEKVARRLVRWDRIRSGIVLVIVSACVHSAPHFYGQYNDLAPKVAPTQGERTPRHLTVQLAKPANVAVFLVVPGRGSTLLFPADSLQSQYVDAGSHLVETKAARVTTSDTSRLARIPNSSQPPQGQRGRNNPNNRTSAFPRDSALGLGFNQHGYLLIYASQQPLNYSLLSTKVEGLSLPIDDDDALNTVWKLIRSVTQTTGPFAASASDYPP
jgi:hypothetical protein